MLSDIFVTTADIKENYQVIGPVYFQVSNKGMFSSALSKLVKQYEGEILNMKRSGQMNEVDRVDWDFCMVNTVWNRAILKRHFS